MVHFRDYTSSSSKRKYLIVDAKNGGAVTKLLTYPPLVGRYANLWPPLQNFLHMVDWTSEHNQKSTKIWSLQTPYQRKVNIASTLPCLGRRIIQREIRWGDTLRFDGEYHHIPGYWEWAEDILGRSQQTLEIAKIYDAVYASLFTYDRNSNILQAFLEAWCPTTNTLLTSAGELFISLWDLHTIGGLPIGGSPYEEVVPETIELTGVNEKNKRFTPRACGYLFTAFNHLQEGESHDPKVSFIKWIEFWCNKDLRYKPAPARREKKSTRLKSTYNPTGAILEVVTWSSEDDTMFANLGVRHEKREGTYLAVFLSCWLCAFVFPSQDGDFIRPETFKSANMMAVGSTPR